MFADDFNDRGPVLATDGRYRTQAAEQAPDVDVAIERALGRYLVGQAADAGARTLGFESNVVTVDGFDALTGELNDRKACTELVKAAGTVEALREVKDAGEVALLRLACGRPTPRSPTWWRGAGCGPAAPSARSAGSWRP